MPSCLSLLELAEQSLQRSLGTHVQVVRAVSLQVFEDRHGLRVVSASLGVFLVPDRHALESQQRVCLDRLVLGEGLLEEHAESTGVRHHRLVLVVHVHAVVDRPRRRAAHIVRKRGRDHEDELWESTRLAQTFLCANVVAREHVAERESHCATQRIRVFRREQCAERDELLGLAEILAALGRAGDVGECRHRRALDGFVRTLERLQERIDDCRRHHGRLGQRIQRQVAQRQACCCLKTRIGRRQVLGHDCCAVEPQELLDDQRLARELDEREERRDVQVGEALVREEAEQGLEHVRLDDLERLLLARVRRGGRDHHRLDVLHDLLAVASNRFRRAKLLGNLPQRQGRVTRKGAHGAHG